MALVLVQKKWDSPFKGNVMPNAFIEMQAATRSLHFPPHLCKLCAVEEMLVKTLYPNSEPTCHKWFLFIRLFHSIEGTEEIPPACTLHILNLDISGPSWYVPCLLPCIFCRYVFCKILALHSGSAWIWRHDWRLWDSFTVTSTSSTFW